MSTLVSVWVVIVEEYDDEPPYGSGYILNRECVTASRSYDEAREVYDSHAEFWADKSRFSVILHREDVKPEMARKLPGAKEVA